MNSKKAISINGKNEALPLKKNWYTCDLQNFIKRNSNSRQSIFDAQFKNKIIEKPKSFNTMKKLIYILMLSFLTAITITSCTEEEVTPQAELNGGGGGMEDRPK